MKRHLKFLVLIPCFFAAICDPFKDDCGVPEPEDYIVNVENISVAYQQNETIWLNAQTSSMLVDFCSGNSDPILIADEEVFLDGLFILKLTDSSPYNAEIFDNVIITYDIGEAFEFNSCSNAFNYLPILTEDEMFYQYRLGITIDIPGDYCIVNAKSSLFDLQQENNSEIFDAYNVLNNRIRFESCGNVYTRRGTDGYYFLRIEE